MEDKSIPYLKALFNDYKGLFTKKERIDFLYQNIQQTLIHTNKLVYEDEVHREHHDLTLFLMGFMDLENGRVPTMEVFSEKGIFYDNRFLLLGGALANYAEAQRTSRREVCEKSRDLLLDFYGNQEHFWFTTYKLGKANYLLGNLYEKDGDQFYREALRLFDEVIQEENPNKQDKSFPHPWNAKGDVYIKMRKYAETQKERKNYNNKAEEMYREALGINPRFAPAHNGLGNFYRKNKEFHEAIKEYEKAIQFDKDFFYPWYYMGDCYRLLERHDKAEEYYTRAHQLNRDQAFPYYGLGRIYYELGNRTNTGKKHYYYEKAEAYFSEAIGINENYLYAVLDMARVLEKMKRFVEAKAKYEKAESLANEYYKDVIQGYIEDIDKTSSIEKQLKERDAKEPSEVGEIIYQTVNTGIEETLFNCKQNFIDTFLREKQKQPDDQITLEVLKRWNSYTPLITENSRGGGYFLKVFGRGIVIDPGFDFIDNFKTSNYVFSDIDIVLVSHSHDDHTADLEAIISLLYRYNRELQETIVPRNVAKEHHTATKDVKAAIEAAKKGWDHLTAKQIEWVNRYRDEFYNKRKKRVDFYVSAGVYEKYKGYFEWDPQCYDLQQPRHSEEEANYSVKIVQYGEKIPLFKHDESKCIDVVNASHEDKTSRNPSLGFLFHLGETLLVYTGDTGWTEKETPERPNIQRQYQDIKGSNPREKIVLLAHIGGVHGKEKNYLENMEESLYPNHLGRLGLAKLVKTLEPEICVISEWGEEFRDFRIPMTKIFAQAFGGKYYFLPGDIGLKIDLSKRLVRAISQIDVESRQMIYIHVSPDQVRFGEFKNHNSLYYYENCQGNRGVTNKDCLQAFFEEFAEVKENAQLCNLTLDGGNLCPVFRPNVTVYSAHVSDNAGIISVTPTAADPAATITVNNESVSSTEKVDFPLKGTESIKITVENGTARESYTMVIKRKRLIG